MAGIAGAFARFFLNQRVAFAGGSYADGLADDYDTDNGNAAWDAVGKSSLGAPETRERLAKFLG